jgi:hypothetical protein
MHAALCCVLQGMNFLVGLLLLAVERDCERCFWLLLVLLEKVRQTTHKATPAIMFLQQHQQSCFSSNTSNHVCIPMQQLCLQQLCVQQLRLRIRSAARSARLSGGQVAHCVTDTTPSSDPPCHWFSLC